MAETETTHICIKLDNNAIQQWPFLFSSLLSNKRLRTPDFFHSNTHITSPSSSHGLFVFNSLLCGVMGTLWQLSFCCDLTGPQIRRGVLILTPDCQDQVCVHVHEGAHVFNVKVVKYWKRRFSTWRPPPGLTICHCIYACVRADSLWQQAKTWCAERLMWHRALAARKAKLKLRQEGL